MRFARERAGLTLIEVLASLTLLTTLLVAVLQSHDRLSRQTRLAGQRLSAIEAADQLLAQWSATEPMLIPASRGQTFGKPSFAWTIETRIETDLEPLGVQVATLKLFARERASGDPPLAAVEFLTTAAVGDGQP